MSMLMVASFLEHTHESSMRMCMGLWRASARESCTCTTMIWDKKGERDTLRGASGWVMVQEGGGRESGVLEGGWGQMAIV